MMYIFRLDLNTNSY